jgi:hypothetical protein
MADAPITLGMEPYTSGLLGNKMLVWGIGKTRELNPVGGVYDIATDTWKKMADPPIKAIDDWPALFFKNKFIVWGAPDVENSGHYGAVYDIDRDEWKVMATAPIMRRNWSASVIIGKKLLVWGGCEGPVEAHTGTSRADGALYDIEKDSWTEISPAPLEARWASRAFAWGRKAVIWGGMGKSENEDQFFFYDGAVYDPEKDAWEKIPEAPLKGDHPRKLYSYGIFGYNPMPPQLSGNKLIVWSMSCNAIYDLAKKTWEEMPGAPISGRDYHTLLLYGNKLIVWGGRDDKSAKADGAVFLLNQ